ncbi:MAG: hypothetical protein ACD_24C00049G0001 [uncultured bacterium]|nr:MAG: hypothetical protein ACD_24C00049G0001 [uncultured bacterium]
MFFLFETVFFQLIPLKAERYISTLEISLPFLVVIGTRWFLRRDFLGNNKTAVYILVGVILVFYAQVFAQRVAQEPTGYHALRNYIEKETQGFTEFKRVYIYGSVRSARWYKQNTAENMFEFSKNLEEVCPQLNEFTYVFFDKKDLVTAGNTVDIYSLVRKNAEKYYRNDIEGFEGYVKKEGVAISVSCL